MHLIIEPDGTVRCVYDETVDLHELGRVHIQRGSHVEPDESGRWYADLSPVSGPSLGPFSMRSRALTAELDWLRRYWLSSHRGSVDSTSR